MKMCRLKGREIILNGSSYLTRTLIFGSPVSSHPRGMTRLSARPTFQSAKVPGFFTSDTPGRNARTLQSNSQ